MLNCMICAPFLLLCLVLLVWEVFVDFDLVNPKHDGTVKILRPYGSKKIVKKAQRHPVQENHGQYHSPEESSKSSRIKIDLASKPEASTVWPWLCPWCMASSAPPSLLDFFAIVHVSTVRTFVKTSYYNNKYLIFQPHFIIISLTPIHSLGDSFFLPP